jgi:hypothetical protein
MKNQVTVGNTLPVTPTVNPNRILETLQKNKIPKNFLGFVVWDWGFVVWDLWRKRNFTARIHHPLAPQTTNHKPQIPNHTRP